MKQKEKGVVFLDGANKPYLIKKWGEKNELWLFYWHPEGHWTSLRKVHYGEKFPDNLTEADQDVYHAQHQKWVESLQLRNWPRPGRDRRAK